MKGIILAGGNGTRLRPMTKVTNKHLLPVYDRPMIMWPLQSLKMLGITDILIISGKGHAGHFLELLGSGKEHGVQLSYAVQEMAGGIAEALLLAEDFADNGEIAVILGDNVYEKKLDTSEYTNGARLFLKEVDDPERFGVATVSDGKITKVVEKPSQPESKLAVSGFYLYDATVFDKIRTLEPSDRGELEISDVNNLYIKEGKAEYREVDGFWTDAGTVDSLYRASTMVRANLDQS